MGERQKRSTRNWKQLDDDSCFIIAVPTLLNSLRTPFKVFPPRASGRKLQPLQLARLAASTPPPPAANRQTQVTELAAKTGKETCKIRVIIWHQAEIHSTVRTGTDVVSPLAAQRCEATTFLIELHTIGAHNCEVLIYRRRVTQDVSRKAWSNDKRITKIWNYFPSIVTNFTGRMSLRAPIEIYAGRGTRESGIRKEMLAATRSAGELATVGLHDRSRLRLNVAVDQDLSRVLDGRVTEAGPSAGGLLRGSCRSRAEGDAQFRGAGEGNCSGPTLLTSTGTISRNLTSPQGRGGRDGRTEAKYGAPDAINPWLVTSRRVHRAEYVHRLRDRGRRLAEPVASSYAERDAESNPTLLRHTFAVDWRNERGTSVLRIDEENSVTEERIERMREDGERERKRQRRREESDNEKQLCQHQTTAVAIQIHPQERSVAAVCGRHIRQPALQHTPLASKRNCVRRVNSPDQTARSNSSRPLAWWGRTGRPRISSSFASPSVTHSWAKHATPHSRQVHVGAAVALIWACPLSNWLRDLGMGRYWLYRRSSLTGADWRTVFLHVLAIVAIFLVFAAWSENGAIPKCQGGEKREISEKRQPADQRHRPARLFPLVKIRDTPLLYDRLGSERGQGQRTGKQPGRMPAVFLFFKGALLALRSGCHARERKHARVRNKTAAALVFQKTDTDEDKIAHSHMAIGHPPSSQPVGDRGGAVVRSFTQDEIKAIIHANDEGHRCQNNVPIYATIRQDQASFHIRPAAREDHHMGICRWPVTFFGVLPFPPSQHSGAAPCPHRFTHIGTEETLVKSLTSKLTRRAPTETKQNLTEKDKLGAAYVKPELLFLDSSAQDVKTVTGGIGFRANNRRASRDKIVLCSSGRAHTSYWTPENSPVTSKDCMGEREGERERVEHSPAWAIINPTPPFHILTYRPLCIPTTTTIKPKVGEDVQAGVWVLERGRGEGFIKAVKTVAAIGTTSAAKTLSLTTTEKGLAALHLQSVIATLPLPALMEHGAFQPPAFLLLPCLSHGHKKAVTTSVDLCFTPVGVGPLVFIRGSMDIEDYCNILDDEMLPTLWCFYGMDPCYFQDDNPRCHIPDLNPIEHLCDELDRRVRSRQAKPKSIAQLMEWLQEEWRRIPVNVLQTLVESMPNRVAAVIAARGICRFPATVDSARHRPKYPELTRVTYNNVPYHSHHVTRDEMSQVDTNLIAIWLVELRCKLIESPVSIKEVAVAELLDHSPPTKANPFSTRSGHRIFACENRAGDAAVNSLYNKPLTSERGAGSPAGNQSGGAVQKTGRNESSSRLAVCRTWLRANLIIRSSASPGIGRRHKSPARDTGTRQSPAPCCVPIELLRRRSRCLHVMPTDTATELTSPSHDRTSVATAQTKPPLHCMWRLLPYAYSATTLLCGWRSTNPQGNTPLASLYKGSRNNTTCILSEIEDENVSGKMSYNDICRAQCGNIAARSYSILHSTDNVQPLFCHHIMGADSNTGQSEHFSNANTNPKKNVWLTKRITCENKRKLYNAARTSNNPDNESLQEILHILSKISVERKRGLTPCCVATFFTKNFIVRHFATNIFVYIFAQDSRGVQERGISSSVINIHLDFSSTAGFCSQWCVVNCCNFTHRPLKRSSAFDVTARDQWMSRRSLVSGCNTSSFSQPHCGYCFLLRAPSVYSTEQTPACLQHFATRHCLLVWQERRGWLLSSDGRNTDSMYHLHDGHWFLLRESRVHSCEQTTAMTGAADSNNSLELGRHAPRPEQIVLTATASSAKGARVIKWEGWGGGRVGPRAASTTSATRVFVNASGEHGICADSKKTLDISHCRVSMSLSSSDAAKLLAFNYSTAIKTCGCNTIRPCLEEGDDLPPPPESLKGSEILYKGRKIEKVCMNKPPTHVANHTQSTNTPTPHLSPRAPNPCDNDTDWVGTEHATGSVATYSSFPTPGIPSSFHLCFARISFALRSSRNDRGVPRVWWLALTSADLSSMRTLPRTGTWHRLFNHVLYIFREYGTAPERKGGENGRSQWKPVDQRHRSARFPRAKIRGSTRRESNPIRLGRLMATHHMPQRLYAQGSQLACSLPVGDLTQPDSILTSYTTLDVACSRRGATVGSSAHPSDGHIGVAGSKQATTRSSSRGCTARPTARAIPALPPLCLRAFTDLPPHPTPLRRELLPSWGSWSFVVPVPAAASATHGRPSSNLQPAVLKTPLRRFPRTTTVQLPHLSTHPPVITAICQHHTALPSLFLAPRGSCTQQGISGRCCELLSCEKSDLLNFLHVSVCGWLKLTSTNPQYVVCWLREALSAASQSQAAALHTRTHTHATNNNNLPVSAKDVRSSVLPHAFTMMTSSWYMVHKVKLLYKYHENGTPDITGQWCAWGGVGEGEKAGLVSPDIDYRGHDSQLCLFVGILAVQAQPEYARMIPKPSCVLCHPKHEQWDLKRPKGSAYTGFKTSTVLKTPIWLKTHPRNSGRVSRRTKKELHNYAVLKLVQKISSTHQSLTKQKLDVDIRVRQKPPAKQAARRGRLPAVWSATLAPSHAVQCALYNLREL
ncbi:hypothetical protein PR048_017283 [Dryococelus australis]|uniref:Uncharacterized protein n=1 Tax=Dryococelus australis TaxID=614101 RepID=A0ABQ9H927_9NEOP|nr:hypothetical protein PR048_017283 [Dryococelus australis]